jgi:competence protein ComEA
MWGELGIREKVLLLLFVLLLLGGVLWKAAPAVLSVPPGGIIEESALSPAEQTDGVDDEPEMITVHLVGAVQKAGVYDLPAGSRVYELLEAAGGAVADADLESVNLARPLYDGEQVIIYTKGEATDGAASPGEPSAQKVNINKATVEELQTLPAIGEVRARGIIDHRNEYGPFTDIEEIMDVSGIGPGIFNQIKDQITIY